MVSAIVSAIPGTLKRSFKRFRKRFCNALAQNLHSSLVTVLVSHKVLNLPCKYPLIHKTQSPISAHTVPNLMYRPLARALGKNVLLTFEIVPETGRLTSE